MALNPEWSYNNYFVAEHENVSGKYGWYLQASSGSAGWGEGTDFLLTVPSGYRPLSNLWSVVFIQTPASSIGTALALLQDTGNLSIYPAGTMPTAVDQLGFSILWKFA